jgi:hypothetical protein
LLEHKRQHIEAIRAQGDVDADGNIFFLLPVTENSKKWFHSEQNMRYDEFPAY